MSDLVIPQHILDDIVAHARELDPYECCGFLAGNGQTVSRVYRIKNIVALEGAAELASFDGQSPTFCSLSPAERAEIAFVMDAQEMFLRGQRHAEERLDPASRLPFPST